MEAIQAEGLMDHRPIGANHNGAIEARGKISPLPIDDAERPFKTKYGQESFGRTAAEVGYSAAPRSLLRASSLSK
jgi:hypothetical protein